MPTKAEIDEIVSWCEKRKAQEKRLALVERNPFRERIKWTYRYPLVEIDRPTEYAAKTSLVYDSLSKQLWHFMHSDWRKIEPDFVIK
jgi:hypothetical protein